MNSRLSEKPATFERPQGQRNGAENIQETEKKTFASIQSEGSTSKALAGDKTLAQLSQEYEVNQNHIVKWK